jgi:hypothetical protein
MADVVVMFEDLESSPGYKAPSATFAGEATTRFAAPEGYALWVAAGTVGKGSTLEWSENHGDEALYLERGSVELDGEVCGDGGAVILERGAGAHLSFLEDSSVVHFGHSEADPAIQAADGTKSGKVHILNGPTTVRGHTDVFIDGNCPTCQISFQRVTGAEPAPGGSHSHSADEIMYVTNGPIRTGRAHLEAGMAAAIPADRLYSFRTDGPWQFLNYRSRPSETYRPRPRD